MKKLIAILSLVLTVAVSVQAEIYVKTKTHADAFMGQPAKDDFSEMWLGDNKSAVIQAGQSFITDVKKNVLYVVNHNDKTYVETTLPLDISKILPAQVAQMMGALKVSVSVTPNGQTKKIGQWNCSGYDVSLTMMMPIQMTMWASTDIPAELTSFMDKGYANIMKATYMMDDAAINEMKKVKGYPINTTVSVEMMGVKMGTTSEVVEISKKTPDASVYAVPAGYQKTDAISMPGGIR